MSDQLQKNILELLTVLAASLNPIDPQMYALTVLKAGNLSIKYGNTDFSPIGYTGFGILMGGVMGNYTAGHEFEQVAVGLTEEYHNRAARCMVNFVIGACVSHWTQHGNKSVDYLEKAVRYGLEAGETNFVGTGASYSLESKCFLGIPLPHIYEECLSLRRLAVRLKHKTLLMNTIIFQRFSACLMGLSRDLSALDQEEYGEEVFSKVSENVLAAYYVAELQLAYLNGEYATALAVADKAEKLMYWHARKGYINAADYLFYYSLAITAAYDELPAERRHKYRQGLKKNQEQMKKWSTFCAGNFLHKYLLVEAEKARLAERHLKAMSLYDQAIQSAYENGYLQNEALAGELAARYYLAQGRRLIARTYLSESWSTYYRWGAIAKARSMQERYSSLLDGMTIDKVKDKSTEVFIENMRNLPARNSDSISHQDLSTIKKVVQTLSAKSTPETMLAAFLAMAVENAGADRGFLILEQSGKLYIEAILESSATAGAVTPIPLEENSHLSHAVVRYVARTLETVVINETQQAGIFARDRYFTRSPAQSVVCLPMLFYGIPAGVLYLENTVMPGVFVPERLEVLKLLSTQMAYVNKLHSFLSGDLSKSEEESHLPQVPLTERELEVLQLIAVGLSNKEIAQRLAITISTVKTHIINIYGKLQVNRRVQAVSKAKELKLIDK
jgi:histidine kinase